jgi:trans-2,3-dihydro-3-hydroxyanthranilate isomerase
MAERSKIYIIDSFTAQPYRGNSAAVAFGSNLTNAEMQLIAREMNLSETVFISNSVEADFKLQWFTRSHEVQLCGHGTIAALHFLNEEKIVRDEISFETLSGILNCGCREGKYFMQIPLYGMEEFKGDKEEAAEALGINKSVLYNAYPFILLENKNLYVYIEQLEDLKNINPNLKLLKDITLNKKEFEGVVLFSSQTIDEESTAHIRYFTPAFGIDEDPVTGSAAGPLPFVMKKLGLLRKDFPLTIEQGDFMNRRGRVTVDYVEDKNELYILGDAVTVMKGELVV